MKCDLCEHEATVHEVTVRNGVKVERHLCEACAAQQGINAQPAIAPAELIKMILDPAGARRSQAKAAASCSRCGMTFAEFKQGGLLGCPACYKALEGQLGPLIERAHEGATQHVGKSPKRGATPAEHHAPSGDAGELVQRVSQLRRMLEDAVRAEHYERAARLRDELRKLTGADEPTQS